MTSGVWRYEPVDLESIGHEENPHENNDCHRTSATIPKRRRRRYSYDESVDEPAKLIEDEPVGVEQEIPVEENEPVESIEKSRNRDTPAFEE